MRQGSEPPKVAVVAWMVHELFPTHAAATTAIDVFALHVALMVGGERLEQPPAGAPYEANATPVNTPPAPHVRVRLPFSCVFYNALRA